MYEDVKFHDFIISEQSMKSPLHYKNQQLSLPHSQLNADIIFMSVRYHIKVKQSTKISTLL